MSGTSGIRLLDSGNYQIRYTGPDGKRYSGGTYRTKTDARNALAVILASISDRTWREKKARVEEGELSGKSSLSQWSEEWIAMRTSGRSGKPLTNMTKKHYRGLVSSALSTFDRPIETITPNQVRKWWAQYRVGRPRGANSAYKYMKSLLAWAVKRGAISENPCDIEGASSYEPKAKGKLTSRETLQRLVSDTDAPWNAFFAVVIYGGLRRGELAELRRKDIHFDSENTQRLAIDVTRSVRWLTNSNTEVGAPKSQSGFRRVWLSPVASKVLLEHLESVDNSEDALLFSRDGSGREHLLESTIQNQIRKLQAEFGFTESLHRLRDFSLTYYAQQGATLQEIMSRGGHSNVKAAMAYQRDAGRDAELAERMT